MNKTAALIAALLLFCPLPSLAQKKASSSAQKKTPAKAIRFEGAPQYPQEELLAASGLKPGVRLTPSDVRAHAKQLNDTGFFAVVKFTTDSKGLLLTLTPASQLFSIHLDNLPLKPGKELDDQLHAQFPLFHGLVPANGSVVDGIRQTFEEMLANQGIKATVKAEVTSGLGPSKITAMNFTVVSPPVRIGYPFKDKLNGRLQISITKKGNNAEIAVADDGSNAATDEPERFGYKFIEVVINQIGGTFRIEKNEITKRIARFRI